MQLTHSKFHQQIWRLSIRSAREAGVVNHYDFTLSPSPPPSPSLSLSFSPPFLINILSSVY